MLLDGKTTTLLRKKLVRLFSPPLTPTFGERREDNIRLFAKLTLIFSLRATLSFSRCVFAERKRIYYKKVRGAALAKVNLL